MLFLAIISIIIILLIVYIISVSNWVNGQRIKISESQSSIAIQLKKRYDTLTQSLNVAKGYANHEKEIMLNLRNVNPEIMSLEDIKDISVEQADACTKLVALGEAYPELKSSELFVKLQDQLSTENAQFAAAKRAFNANVSALNSKIVMFPSSIVCAIKHVEQMEFIQEETIDDVKDVNLTWDK